MAVVEQLSDGNDDGCTLGISATDKISFYGVTPVVQPSGAGQAAYVTIGQHALTDNGGGTADQTVASQAAPTTITDSSGLSGTHDDTLAATTTPTTLTDSTGQSGTHDDTLAATTTQADLTGGEAATEAEMNTLLAEVRVICQNASDTAQKVIEIITLQAVQSQNISDLGQKVIELVTLAGVAQANLKEVTTELALIRTDISNTRLLGTAERTALINLGLIAGA